jgi:copper oxidase (laccase) domain-containing protein
VEYRTGRYLDLRAANAVLLRRLGVRDIRAVAECTACSPRLHSSRRDGGGLRCRLMAVLLVPAAR